MHKRSTAQRPVAVVCHKGANRHAPENTFAAARVCVAWGVDYVEVDVNASKDGELFLLHGPFLDSTTNGRGWIGDLTAPEIDRLDAGRWFGPAFQGERVPRLAEFLRWIRGKAGVFLDVKTADPARLATLLERTGMTGACFVWAKDPQWMQAFHALAPQVELKVNVREPAQVPPARAEQSARMVEVGPENVTPEMVAACREVDVRLMVNYMDDDPAVLRPLLAAEIDLINTDHGDLVLQLLGEPPG